MKIVSLTCKILIYSILGGGIPAAFLMVSCSRGDDKEEPVSPPRPATITDFTDGGHFRFDDETGEWVEVPCDE